MNKYEKSLLNLTCDLELTEQNQIDFRNIKELVERETEVKTIYGYDVEDLKAIAIEMNNKDLTVEELKNSLEMYKKGFEEGFAMCKKGYDYVLKNIFRKSVRK